MDWKKFWEWLKTKPNWYSITVIIICAIIAIMSILVTGCSSQYKVVQSSYNTSTGDSIVIRYETTGNIKKN